MTHKWLHTLVFVFALSISAHLAHEVTAHENAVCEVCLHGKSLEDGLNELDANHGHRIHQSNQINQLWISAFVDSTHQTSDPIRGPPQFS